MSGWEYRKIALNQLSAKVHDVDVLNDAGDEGWELVAILPNHVAYFKRQIVSSVLETAELTGSDLAERGQPEVNGTIAVPRPTGFASGKRVHDDDHRSEVKAKYRDPKTGDTWSGRGRMATWLKRKQDAGEETDDYLV